MVTWTQGQTGTAVEQSYTTFLRALLGEASDAEIEQRYVALARMILVGEQPRHQAA